MRSPSVTTMIATSRRGQLASTSRDAAAIGGAHEDAARALEDVAVLLAGETDRRRVDDRHHLVGIVDQQAEEQRLVAVVQRSQVDVLLEVARLAPEVLEHARELLLLRGDVRRQQPAQVQRVALGLGERRALVERRILQQRDASRHRGHRFVIDVSGASCVPRCSLSHGRCPTDDGLVIKSSPAPS